MGSPRRPVARSSFSSEGMPIGLQTAAQRGRPIVNGRSNELTSRQTGFVGGGLSRRRRDGPGEPRRVDRVLSVHFRLHPVEVGVDRVEVQKRTQPLHPLLVIRRSGDGRVWRPSPASRSGATPSRPGRNPARRRPRTCGPEPLLSTRRASPDVPPRREAAPPRGGRHPRGRRSNAWAWRTRSVNRAFSSSTHRSIRTDMVAAWRTSAMPTSPEGESSSVKATTRRSTSAASRSGKTTVAVRPCL